STRFDPTSDINARLPNGAMTSGNQSVLNTTSWPRGNPPREIGLGDYGPLNVEFNRARSPFLDLDADNSSGARGVDYVGKFSGTAVPIAGTDARFANSLFLNLQQL